MHTEYLVISEHGDGSIDIANVNDEAECILLLSLSRASMVETRNKNGRDASITRHKIVILAVN